jgi:hypothetical protein
MDKGYELSAGSVADTLIGMARLSAAVALALPKGRNPL